MGYGACSTMFLALLELLVCEEVTCAAKGAFPLAP